MNPAVAARIATTLITQVANETGLETDSITLEQVAERMPDYLSGSDIIAVMRAASKIL